MDYFLVKKSDVDKFCPKNESVPYNWDVLLYKQGFAADKDNENEQKEVEITYPKIFNLEAYKNLKGKINLGPYNRFIQLFFHLIAKLQGDETKPILVINEDVHN